jgi:hypothetical protein
MILVNVDFFSSGKVCGWTNAIAIGSKSIIIKTASGLSKDITESINVIRSDVNNQFNFDTNEATGFNINLFDLFNDKIKEFDIYVDGFKAWSSSKQLSKLENEVAVDTKKVFELGGRRLFIIYESGSWLDVISRKIHSWNKNQFNKALNNGVSISFINIKNYKDRVKTIDLSKSNNIFIIERAVVREAIIVNEKIAVSSILILEKNIDLSLDYHGVLNSVFSINGMHDGVKVTASLLRELIDTITTYSEMFFSSGGGTQLYVYGQPSEAMMKVIRNINQEDKIFQGCIILSKEKRVRMSPFNREEDVIFMNSNLLKNTFDIINAEPEELLNVCFKRGIKVQSLSVGEII